jgi:hypothetical protein
MSQDYNEAIQNPAVSFVDPELKAGQAITNALGMPMPRSGNFADVYEFTGQSGNKWALKCFTREVPGLHDRYSEVSKCLFQARLPFTVDFKYLDQGIRIQGRWYPLLKMQWVEGYLLNEFVRQNLDKPTLLDKLGQIWLRMGKRLREAGIAHADLQHGNVILVPGSRASALAVKLIDYDGMVVPALARKRSGELGHPAYQHPQRLQQGIYSAEVDRLPLLAIACALRAVAVGGKALWQRYDNGDNLLFRESDLRQPGDSSLFKELWNLPNAALHDLVGYVALGLMGPLAEVPLLHEVVPDNQPRPLTAAQDQQVTALLGSGARVTRVKPAMQAVWQALSGVGRTGKKEKFESAAAMKEDLSAVTTEPFPPPDAYAFGAEPAASSSQDTNPLSFQTGGSGVGSSSLIRKRQARARSRRPRLIAVAIGVPAVAALAYFLFFQPKNSTKTTNPDAKKDKDKALVKEKESKRPKSIVQQRRKQQYPLEDFTEYGGHWQVDGDELSVDRGPGHKLISNYPAFSTGEVGVEVSIPARGGDHAGLLVKVQEPGLGADNFIGYGIYLSARQKALIFGRHRHNWQLLRVVRIRFAAGIFTPLVVRLERNSMKVLIDDEPVLTYEDKVNPLGAGQIGLRSFGGGCQFRKLWVKTGGRKTDLPFGPE